MMNSQYNRMSQVNNINLYNSLMSSVEIHSSTNNNNNYNNNNNREISENNHQILLISSQSEVIPSR